MVIKTKPNRAEKIMAKNLYKDMHYIRLESHENALIGQRHKTKLFDNHIGVLNLNPRNFILFDRQGNYLLNIDAQGKEPGNLSSTYDFTILDDKIYFPNHINKSISIYTTDGKYQKTIPADHSYMGLSRTENHIVASSKNLSEKFHQAPYNVAVYDADMNRILHFGNVPLHLENINLYDVVYNSHHKNETIYHQILSDTIFRIKDKGEISYNLIEHSPPLIIDKRDKKMTFDLQNGLFDKYLHNTKATYPVRNLLDSNNYLLLFYNYNFKYYITAFTKSSGESLIFYFDSDDARNHIFNPSMDFTALDNTMIIEKNIEDVRRVISALPEDYLSDTNIDTILDDPDMDENANPVLLTYRLNEEYLDTWFEEK